MRTINRFADMETFVRVVRDGGFSAAARSLDLTPSTVSKTVSRMEARLQVRLFNRSTRQLALTPEGTAFFDRAEGLLAEFDEAEKGVREGEVQGRVRINSSASYGLHILCPILPAYLETYPRVTVDIAHTDVVVDLLRERADIAVRAGPLASSSLVARKLGETPMVIVAAPAYLRRFGEPRSVDDLAGHVRLGFAYPRASEGWPMRRDGETVAVPTDNRVRGSDGEMLRVLALNGVGLARMPLFTARDDINEGRLVPVLEAANPGDRETFHALYVGKGGTLPNRVRSLLDYLATHGKVS